jgi:hypothetical protein
LNSRRHERRKVLALSLADGYARRALTKGEMYPFHDLGYREIAEEESGATTRKLTRLRAARKDQWVDKLQIPGGVERADPARKGYRMIM